LTLLLFGSASLGPITGAGPRSVATRSGTSPRWTRSRRFP